MGQPYVGEIRMFGGNFPPAGWMFCSGQLLAISEYDTLFNLIGTTYGGDGQSNFALPDLQCRIPLHMGTDPATGTPYALAQRAGVESVTLTTNQMPVHNHAFVVSAANGDSPNPGNAYVGSSTNVPTYVPQPPTAALAGSTLGVTGGSQPHDNMMPFLAVSFIISLFGIYPTPT
jgi:microcystin-dependent protein